MRFESFPQINYGEHLRQCIVGYKKSEESRQSFDAIEHLYKTDAYKYPEIINPIKELEINGTITHEEHVLVVAIYLMTQRTSVLLPHFESSIKTLKFDHQALFDYEEIRNSKLPKEQIEYLEFCFVKITTDY